MGAYFKCDNSKSEKNQNSHTGQCKNTALYDIRRNKFILNK